MTSPAERESPASVDLPGIDRAALGRWLTENTDMDAAQLRISPIAGGKSNLTYLLEDGTRRWVLRRPPLGPLTPSAHDMLREHRVVAALAGTDVPVPAAVGSHADDDVLGVPFAVYTHVAGRTIRSADDARALPAAAQERVMSTLVDTLAALHRVDPGTVGLGELGRPDGFNGRQVSRWRGQWERVATRDGTAALTLADRLAAEVPAHADTSIVHGDYRLDNVLVGDTGEITAVLDWEMATLGDPLADLALLLVYGDPLTGPVLGVEHLSKAGLPGTDGIVARYAAASGRDLSHLDFSVALAYFKLAVIAEGIHQRYLAGKTIGEGFATIGDAVEPLLAAGTERIA